MDRLQGHVALVTGAARGIGAGIATRLAQDGAYVAVVDRDGAGAEQLAAQLAAEGHDALAICTDVTSEADVQGMVDAALARWGQIDVLVNNAGVTGPAKPSWEYTQTEWRRVLAVDLDSVFLCCRAVVPHMVERGSGRIVNIASIAGKEGNPMLAAYSTAKAGVIGFTKSLGKELATSGVLVNCVAPAVVQTELLAEVTPEAISYMVSRIPMGRTGRIEEVAALVGWLASAECSFSTGAVYDLSGGRATY